MSSDFHGHDPIAEFLDKPRTIGVTLRQNIAEYIALYLRLPNVSGAITEAGLDPADIVRALTGVVLAVLMCQAPECVRDRDCSSGQRCVGGACKVKNNRG